MHYDAPHASGSPASHSVVPALMDSYEALDKLERVLGDIVSTPSAACGSPLLPLTGPLEQLRAAGLVDSTDHFSDH